MIKLTNLSKSYKKQVVFHDAELHLDDPSKIYALIGPSGSGKSTLLNILFGLDFKYQGSYELFGKEAKEYSADEFATLRSNDIQMVFQDFKLFEAMTVFDNLFLAGNYADQQIDEVLGQLDLIEFKYARVKTLSGGQKQRVAIARSVLANPRILLLDEPTGNLDQLTVDSLLEYLERLKNRQMLILIVTHDEDVMEFVDQVYEIEENKIVNKKKTEFKKVNDNKTVASSGKNTSKPLIKYITKSFQARWKEIILLFIPTVIILILTILAYSAYHHEVVGVYDDIRDGLSEEIIKLDVSDYNWETSQQLMEGALLSSTEIKRLGFSRTDVQNVQDIPNVSDVILANTGTTSSIDNEGYELQQSLHVNDFPTDFNRYFGLNNENPNIQFNFKTLNVPKSILSDYNEYNIQLVAGDFPVDESDQLLIPDIYAAYLLENTFIDTNLINQTINLPITDFLALPRKGLVFNNNQVLEKDYQIAGIYQTDYESFIEPQYDVYLGYRDSSDFEYISTLEFYNQSKTNQGILSTEHPYLTSAYESYETYLQSLGTAYPNMLIKVNGANAMPDVYHQLVDLFPLYRIYSLYDFENEDLAGITSYYVNLMNIIGLVMALILGIILTFISSGYIRHRNRELAILYSLGYTRKEVFLALAADTLGIFVIAFLIAYLIVVAIYHFFFTHTSLHAVFSHIFDSRAIMMILLFVCVILLISILWAQRGISLKNLRKSLNES